MHKFMRYILVLAVLVAWLPMLIVYAQRPEPTQNGILVCVRPTGGETGYALLFRETTSFGLVIPQGANVKITSTLKVAALMYTIAPDAPSGGYRFIEQFVQSTALSDEPADPACSTDLPNLAADRTRNTLYSTVMLPVNKDRALVVQVDPSEAPPTAVLGVVGMAFNTTPSLSFQLLQVNKTDRDLQVKVLGLRDVPYSAVSNKVFNLSQSLPDKPNPTAADFSGAIPSSPFGFNIGRFARPADLYAFLSTNNMRIYPGHGLFSVPNDYPYIGGFMSVRLDTQNAERLPRFEAGVRVRALQGASVSYFVPAAPDQVKGRLEGANTATVDKVDDFGRLFIIRGGERDMYIEAWLVEVVE
ncbi:MAG: hypothetical protein DYG88_03555 [Chloroflexi bacterium CFX4]|nr:hypothetical protein [Chloroflexi bacterium CFX4]